MLLLLLFICLILLVLGSCVYKRHRNTPYFIMDGIVYYILENYIRRESDGKRFDGPSVGQDTFMMEGVKYRMTPNAIWRINKDELLENLPKFKRIDGKCNIVISGSSHSKRGSSASEQSSSTFEIDDNNQFVMNGKTYQYLRFKQQAWLISGNDSFTIFNK